MPTLKFELKNIPEDLTKYLKDGIDNVIKKVEPLATLPDDVLDISVEFSTFPFDKVINLLSIIYSGKALESVIDKNK